MKFQRKYLKKWFGGFSDDHPIIKNIKLYPNSKKYWNTLLSDLDSVTGLRRKIAEMKRDPRYLIQNLFLPILEDRLQTLKLLS